MIDYLLLSLYHISNIQTITIQIIQLFKILMIGQLFDV